MGAHTSPSVPTEDVGIVERIKARSVVDHREREVDRPCGRNMDRRPDMLIVDEANMARWEIEDNSETKLSVMVERRMSVIEGE